MIRKEKTFFFLMWSILLLIIPCMVYAQPHQNDKVILLNGDTISTFISADPDKETRLPKKAIPLIDDYGFTEVVAIFPNDSVRLYKPDDIAGYYKHEVGKWIGSGWHESRSLQSKWFRMGFNKFEFQRFVQRFYSHKDFTLYMLRESDPGGRPDYYYLIYYRNPPEPEVIFNFKSWQKWAAANPPFDEIAPALKKPKRREYSFFDMLKDAGRAYKARNP